MIRTPEVLYKGIKFCISRGGRFWQILFIPPMITQFHSNTNKIRFQWWGCDNAHCSAIVTTLWHHTWSTKSCGNLIATRITMGCRYNGTSQMSDIESIVSSSIAPDPSQWSSSTPPSPMVHCTVDIVDHAGVSILLALHMHSTYHTSLTWAHRAWVSARWQNRHPCSHNRMQTLIVTDLRQTQH